MTRSDSTYYRDQAERFDRVADQCTIPRLVPYYRRLADSYRLRGGLPARHAAQDDLEDC
jgi:hypothetical protein